MVVASRGSKLPLLPPGLPQITDVVSPVVCGVPAPAGTLQSYNVNYLVEKWAPVIHSILVPLFMLCNYPSVACRLRYHDV